MTKTAVKLGKTLVKRAQEAAFKEGYSSAEEFIEHAVEKELARVEEGEGKEEVMRKLKGLGYLE